MNAQVDNVHRALWRQGDAAFYPFPVLVFEDLLLGEAGVRLLSDREVELVSTDSLFPQPLHIPITHHL
ncbi:hypothetical protein D9M73_286450 [compost metagenome]